MDPWTQGDAAYHCHWCNQANWEPDLEIPCLMCGRFQPGSRFHEMHKEDSNLRRYRKREAEQ